MTRLVLQGPLLIVMGFQVHWKVQQGTGAGLMPCDLEPEDTVWFLVLRLLGRFAVNYLASGSGGVRE